MPSATMTIAARTFPALGTFATVLVADPDALTSARDLLAANIASTAAILRAERAIGWLDGLRLPARLVRHDGAVVTVAGWPADGPETALAG